MTHSEKVNQVYIDAYNYINSVMVDGQTINFISDVDLKDKSTLASYFLPNAFYRLEHDLFNEFCIGSVTKSVDEILFHGYGKADSFGKKYTFKMAEIDEGNLCAIADLIAETI